ncbi:heavy-metal-associated domain-containing protein [Sporosarcina sp. HYO08]|uniref:heavy-metal-associated domain-containing protein n=1 Tax=Sporosarcina sp. HYO08 TaxID=1759557 RepID=UPI0007942830|nr:heavy metal-associated domain-containing protein [Sporosarcina sp. HYO08]KXH80874.1 heavy metal-binding protein [Sporosarcina sp. HYO08]
MKKAVFTLEPLSCPSCIKKIESTLSKLNGVQEAKVLFNSSKARVMFDAETIQADELQNTIVKLGYPVLSQKVS